MPNNRTCGSFSLPAEQWQASRDFERKVVHHCAPTLAGVKPANLFNCVKIDGSAFRRENVGHVSVVANCRAKLARGGVSLRILLQRETGALVLVYRLAAISRMLAHDPSRIFLEERGYDTSSPHACIRSLIWRLEEHECARGACCRCVFPHEVGLLLGYPYEDVVGFIENEGCGEACTGTWKVYANEAEARSTFACYKEQTRILKRMFEAGIPLDELVCAREQQRYSA